MTTLTRRHTRPSLALLTRVELRKMVDTRSGAWLLGVTALAAAAIVTLQVIFSKPEQRTFAEYFAGTLLATSVLLPVLGILSVTAEWSQRTGLTTFALAPRRSRIAAAKAAAAIVLGLLSVAAGLAVAAVGNAVGALATTGSHSWHLSAATIGQGLLLQVLNVLMGVGFGMLLMNSALAIVVYFLLPTVWTVLGAMIRWLRTPSEWLNFAQATDPLTTGTLSGQGWARAATATALWILLPLLAGLYRLTHRELS